MSKDKSNKNWFVRHKVLTVIIGLVLLGTIFGAAGGGGSSNDNSQPASQPAESNNQSSTEEAESKPDVPAEYTSALAQADSYANTLNLSKKGVYDQLTSEFGGQFSEEAAEYAVDNVKADWKRNALAKAKDYQSQQNLSPEAIHDQLVSSAGEKFTEAEANYALENLDK